jgi:hypothetical protein
MPSSAPTPVTQVQQDRADQPFQLTGPALSQQLAGHLAFPRHAPPELIFADAAAQPLLANSFDPALSDIVQFSYFASILAGTDPSLSQEYSARALAAVQELHQSRHLRRLSLGDSSLEIFFTETLEAAYRRSDLEASTRVYGILHSLLRDVGTDIAPSETGSLRPRCELRSEQALRIFTELISISLQYGDIISCANLLSELPLETHIILARRFTCPLVGERLPPSPFSQGVCDLAQLLCVRLQNENRIAVVAVELCPSTEKNLEFFQFYIAVLETIHVFSKAVRGKAIACAAAMGRLLKELRSFPVQERQALITLTLSYFLHPHSKVPKMYAQALLNEHRASWLPTTLLAHSETPSTAHSTATALENEMRLDPGVLSTVRCMSDFANSLQPAIQLPELLAEAALFRGFRHFRFYDCNKSPYNLLLRLTSIESRLLKICADTASRTTRLRERGAKKIQLLTKHQLEPLLDDVEAFLTEFQQHCARLDKFLTREDEFLRLPNLAQLRFALNPESCAQLGPQILQAQSLLKRFCGLMLTQTQLLQKSTLQELLFDELLYRPFGHHDDSIARDAAMLTTEYYYLLQEIGPAYQGGPATRAQLQKMHSALREVNPVEWLHACTAQLVGLINTQPRPSQFAITKCIERFSKEAADIFRETAEDTTTEDPNSPGYQDLLNFHSAFSSFVSVTFSSVYSAKYSETLVKRYRGLLDELPSAELRLRLWCGMLKQLSPYLRVAEEAAV